MRQLISTGTVKRGTLGVEVQDLTPEIAHMLGIEPGKGAVVTRVQADSPADSAGLKPGDVIIEINGKTVQNEQDLRNSEGLLPIGAAVELKLVRESKSLVLNTHLAAEQLAVVSGAKIDPRLAGIELTDISQRQRREGLNGVNIARIASSGKAAVSNLKPGDVIIGVNQVNIRNLDDFSRLLAQHPRQLLLSVARGRNAFFLLLE